MILQDAENALKITTPFTIAAASQPSCPPGMTATSCGSQSSATPALRDLAPLFGSQGSTVSMTFTGVNFAAPVSLQFAPTSGITVQSATLTNANQIQAQMLIAPNDALSVRGVILVVGPDKKRLTAANTFAVVFSSTATHRLPMQILRVVPNQVTPGTQDVDLTLEGTNFDPGTQVTFTAGAASSAQEIPQASKTSTEGIRFPMLRRRRQFVVLATTVSMQRRRCSITARD